jgi:hypothetical protein
MYAHTARTQLATNIFSGASVLGITTALRSFLFFKFFFGPVRIGIRLRRLIGIIIIVIQLWLKKFRSIVLFPMW